MNVVSRPIFGFEATLFLSRSHSGNCPKVSTQVPDRQSPPEYLPLDSLLRMCIIQSDSIRAWTICHPSSLRWHIPRE